MMLILAVLYIIRLRTAGLDIERSILFFIVLTVTVITGLLIVKLLTRKIRKNMEDY